MKSETNTSYNQRKVRYEHIHHITADQFDALSDAMNLKHGEKILDAGCGYGSATRELILRNADAKVDYYLLDQSIKQLQSAEEELSPFQQAHPLFYYNSSLLDNEFENGYFDKVLAKKMIHEFPKDQQKEVIQELYRLLKPGGALLVWQNVLDEISQDFFQKVMIKKDALAGFDTMVRKRYFLEEAYFFDCLKEAGFDAPEKYYEFDYHVETVDRLDSELHGDASLLEQWNIYLKSLVAANPVLEGHVHFTVAPQSVGFTIKNAIYIIKKQ